jgi:hypothetical protein
VNENEQDLLFTDTVETLYPAGARPADPAGVDFAVNGTGAGAGAVPSEGELVGAETTELLKLAAREALDELAPPAAGPEALSATRPAVAPGRVFGDAHGALAQPAPDDVPTPGVAAPDSDELGGILQEFEARVHGCVDALLVERSDALERHYEALLEQVRAETAAASAQQEARLRETLAGEYRERNRQLRANYRRLVDAANRMKQQKAQLQEARARFEQKLEAVNALHDKVEEMRRQLRAHLGPDAG